MGTDPQSRRGIVNDLALGTPLGRAPVHAGLVARERLRAVLSPEPARPVTLVSAPAGYGKSTAVAQWLADDPRDSVWLTLGAWDRSPAVFLAHFAGEIRTARPDAMQRTLALLDGDGPPEPSVIGFALLMDLTSISPELVVVLDGIDQLEGTMSLQALGPFLRNPSRSTHLVLIGRSDPALPLGGLRMTDRLAEVRESALRFTVEEVRAMMCAMTDAEISEETATVWTDAARGWVAGLKLALDEKGARVGDSTPNPLACRSVSAYLDQQLLHSLPDELRTFLLHVGVLPRFSAPLLNAIAIESSAHGVFEGERGGALGWLRSRGMFLEALDAEHRWFRFHPVVRAHLRERYDGEHGVEARRALQARFDRWLADEVGAVDLVDGSWPEADRSDRRVGSPSPENPPQTLTRRERETIELLGLGLYYHEIAERSFVSRETVKTHLKHAYRKLRVSNRRQAVQRARALGLIEAADGGRGANAVG